MDAVIEWNKRVLPRARHRGGCRLHRTRDGRAAHAPRHGGHVDRGRPAVLGAVDEDMAFWPHRQLEDHDIDVRVNTTVVGFEEPADGEDRSRPRPWCSRPARTSADRPRDPEHRGEARGQLARAAGSMSANSAASGSISTCAPTIRTSGPSVTPSRSAIPSPRTGRCIPLAGPANRQGRVAADNVMGRPSRYRGTWGTSVVRVFDLTVAATGLSERLLRRAGIAFETVHVHPLSHVSYYPGAEMLDMKLVFSAEDGTIYGAQVVGDDIGSSAHRRPRNGDPGRALGRRRRPTRTLLRPGLRSAERPGQPPRHGSPQCGERRCRDRPLVRSRCARRERRCCSTSAVPPSTPPAASPARSTSRSTSCATVSASSIRTSASSSTASRASARTSPIGCFGFAASTYATSPAAFGAGRQRSRPRPPDTLAEYISALANSPLRQLRHSFATPRHGHSQK